MYLGVAWWIPQFAEMGVFTVDIKPYVKTFNIDLDDMVYMGEHLVYKNKLLGLPFQVNGFNWAYNSSMFQENGVPLVDDTYTRDDMVEAAKATTDADNGRWGIRSVTAHSVWMPTVFANGGEMWDGLNGDCVLDSPEATEAIELLLNLVHRERVAPTPEQTKDKGYSWFKKNYAMQMSNPAGNWNWNPDLVAGQFDWDVMYAPIMKRTGKRAVQLNEQPYHVTDWARRRDNVADAIQVVNFHAGTEVQGMIADVGGATPARWSILDSNRFMPPPQDRQRFVDSFAWREGVKPHIHWLPWWQAINGPLREGLEGKIPPLQVSREMTHVGNAAIEKTRATGVEKL